MIIVETTQVLLLLTAAIAVFGVLFMQVLECEQSAKKLEEDFYKEPLPEATIHFSWASMMPKDK